MLLVWHKFLSQYAPWIEPLRLQTAKHWHAWLHQHGAFKLLTVSQQSAVSLSKEQKALLSSLKPGWPLTCYWDCSSEACQRQHTFVIVITCNICLLISLSATCVWECQCYLGTTTGCHQNWAVSIWQVPDWYSHLPGKTPSSLCLSCCAVISNHHKPCRAVLAGEAPNALHLGVHCLQHQNNGMSQLSRKGNALNIGSYVVTAAQACSKSRPCVCRVSTQCIGPQHGLPAAQGQKNAAIVA